MFIKLNNGVVINTKYIVQIEPYVSRLDTRNKYIVYMVDKHTWSITEEDFCNIIDRPPI